MQEGIISLKNLKNLEVLDINMDKISPKIVKQGLCTEKRPSLLRVCLPRTTFKVKDLEVLLEIAPNLNHMCIKKKNREKIEVRIINKLIFSHPKIISCKTRKKLQDFYLKT